MVRRTVSRFQRVSLASLKTAGTVSLLAPSNSHLRDKVSDSERVKPLSFCASESLPFAQNDLLASGFHHCVAIRRFACLLFVYLSSFSLPLAFRGTTRPKPVRACFNCFSLSTLAFGARCPCSTSCTRCHGARQPSHNDVGCRLTYPVNFQPTPQGSLYGEPG